MNDLIRNPNYLAYKFNFNSENVEFLPIKPGEVRQVSALKLDYFDANRQLIPVPLSELVPLVNRADEVLRKNPSQFIFHTAFCASTFLSRCLDVDGYSVSLREPQILLDAANAKRLQWQSRTTPLNYSHMPKLALSLLQKHAETTERLLIKPINSVNNIIPELLQITGSAKSLLLYTDARNFLLSSLRKGESGKHVIRAMFDLARCDFPHLANLSLSAMLHMTDLNIILTLWRLQTEQAEQALQRFSPSNTLASLYGETLIHKPFEALQAANRFLELGIPAEKLDSIVNSDNRSKDAKSQGEQFSLKKRQARYQRLEDFYGEDLQNGLNWMLKNNPGTRLEPAMTGTLIQ